MQAKGGMTAVALAEVVESETRRRKSRVGVHSQ